MKIERTQVVKIILEEQEIYWLRRSINMLPSKVIKAILGKECIQFLDKLWENL